MKLDFLFRNSLGWEDKTQPLKDSKDNIDTQLGIPAAWQLSRSSAG
jgi:hypothetical protein